MRAFSTKLGRVDGFLSVAHHRVTRSLRFSHSNPQDNQDAALARKVTKKSYSDLPKVRVLPDGTHAPPLKDWQGGLSPPVARKKSLKSPTGRALVQHESPFSFSH